jgi:hypothetical protein
MNEKYRICEGLILVNVYTGMHRVITWWSDGTVTEELLPLSPVFIPEIVFWG